MKNNDLFMDVFNLELKREFKNAFEVEAVRLLEKKNQRIAYAIILRYGFDGMGQKTYEEVAKLLPSHDGKKVGIGLERARQVVLQGLRYLKYTHKLNKYTRIEECQK